MAEQWVGPQDGSTQPGQPKKKSNGCLIAILIFVALILIGGGLAGYLAWKGLNKVKDAFVNEFAEGYDSHTGQVIKISDEMTGDHLYIAQTVTIDAPNDGNLALLVQSATINADIMGDVAAMTQTLKVDKGAVIHGDLHFTGQTGLIEGEVKGNISGTAQMLTVREDLMGRVTADVQSLNTIPMPEGMESPDTIATEQIDTLKVTEEEVPGDNSKVTEQPKEEPQQEAQPEEKTPSAGSKKKVKK